MKKNVLLITLMFVITTMAQSPKPVGYWTFDNLRSELRELEMVRGETFLPKERYEFVLNSIDNVESDLNGKYYKQVNGVVNGVVNGAVLLDGNIAYIRVQAENVPRVEGDFSVEAWVAMGAYPNNVSPIINNQRDPGEYNQENDRSALNYILDSDVDFEIALVRYNKESGTDTVRAYLSDIEVKMPVKGPRITNPVTVRHGKVFTNFGDYSVDLFRNIDELHDDSPSRALFDMAAIAIFKNASWAISSQIPSPTLVNGMCVERPENKRKITLWENFNKEKIIQDFYSSMENYVLAK